MSQQLWTPIGICKALVQIGASAPHLNTRMRTERVEPTIRGKGQGSKNRYSAHGAILYCLATKIENTGVEMHPAYEMANEILNHYFETCLSGDVHPYVVKLSGNLGQVGAIFFSGEKPGEFNQDQFIKFHPLPTVTVWAPKDRMREIIPLIGRTEFISFLNAAYMVRDCIERLGVNESEVEALKKRSDDLIRKGAETIIEQSEKLMNDYTTLYNISLILTPGSVEHQETINTMLRIKEQLKI